MGKKRRGKKRNSRFRRINRTMAGLFEEEPEETEVRLDKFLQVSRLIRRRTVAQEFCQSGKVRQNGKASKPGAKVNPGDVLEIDFGWKVVRVKVLAVDPGAPSGMYEEVTSR